MELILEHDLVEGQIGGERVNGVQLFRIHHHDCLVAIAALAIDSVLLHRGTIYFGKTRGNALQVH